MFFIIEIIEKAYRLIYNIIIKVRYSMKNYLKFNKKYALIFLILLAIILLIGTSYALLRSSSRGENTYVMNVGLLEVTFQDSETNSLSLENAVPMTDNEGMNQASELIFTVKNTGNLAAGYDIYIEETSTSPEFKTVIRFISNKNDTGYNSPKTLSVDKYIDQSTLAIGESATYKVKLWLSETADNTYMNKTFTARIVVDSYQTNDLRANIMSQIISNQADSCQTYVEEDGITYISGSSDCIDFNYVWYSGKLWRITAIYPDGTMKMITDDAITTIVYGENVNFYIDDSNKSWIYQWLNEDFLSTLYNYENIIVTNAIWNATNSNEAGVSTKLPETTMVTAPVGLLNSYEYYKSYQNVSNSNGYLNIGYYWWLLNPYSSSAIWSVYILGDGYEFTNNAHGVRPVITMQSGTMISGGSGTSNNPYAILGDKESITPNTTLLNTRTSGEYVNFDDELYRIVEIDDNTTKLNKVDFIRDENGKVIEKIFQENLTYGNGTSNEYWDYYLNNAWYSEINELYKSMLVKKIFYLGNVNRESGNNYKTSICVSINNNVTIAECEKTTSTWTGYVGLPRYGEMFASQQHQNNSFPSSNMWLITPYYSLSIVWYIANIGYGTGSDRLPATDTISVRPSITLNSNVKIAGGTGLKNDPFEISL